MKTPDVYLYDSLSKQEQRLQPRGNCVDIYFCGPTVYSDAHIGNYRPPVFFDLLRRVLMFIGYDVIIASNMTDVDDKIIQAALKQGISEAELSNFYADRYLSTLEQLNVIPLTYIPRVTETIPQIIDLIQILINRGYAYQVNENVYFRVSKIKDFGKMSNLTAEELISGARIAVNDEKENPLDFVLWKATETGIAWDSPFSRGRPGWHSECVAMIQTLFQHAVHIHGGGFDLKFPHHTNELAQAEAGYDHHLADIWMHVGFVNIQGEKMSKSEGNIITGIEAIKTYQPNTIRHLLISTHYRAPVNVAPEAISNAESEVNKILSTLRAIQLFLLKKRYKLAQNDALPLDFEMQSFIQYLCQDMNISNALTVVHDVCKKIRTVIRSEDLTEAQRLERVLSQMVKVLGYHYCPKELSDDDYSLLAEYELARSNKDYATSDKLRELLTQKGII